MSKPDIESTLRAGDSSSGISAFVYGPTELGFIPPADWDATKSVKVSTPYGTANLSVGNSYLASVQATTGSAYQVQVSTDLVHWTNVGSPISGQGQAIQTAGSVAGTPTCTAKHRRCLPPFLDRFVSHLHEPTPPTSVPLRKSPR